MTDVIHQIRIGDLLFNLGPPRSISRHVSIRENQLIDAFHLPQMSSSPVELVGFIGDVAQGGSCNVNLLKFTPHNLTHIEMSAHISHQGSTLHNRPVQYSCGILQLLDLSHLDPHNQLITIDDIKGKINRELPFEIIGLKSPLSSDGPSVTYSGTNPLALAPEVSEYISTTFPKVHTMVLDLPSADLENDGGKLLAHRRFFEIPDDGLEFIDTKNKAIVELADFSSIRPGIFFVTITLSL